MKRLRIGIVYGGRSGEHEVSVASAASVFANLDREKYDPVPIRIEKDGRWMLADRPPAAPSAADVIDQMRDTARSRNGREVLLPPRPGDDALILVDRRTADADGEDAAAILTGLGLDVVFPVLHGPYGEDGTIQGLLELAGLAYVGCGVLASAVGMDKAVAKVLFQAAGLTVAPAVVIRERDWQSDRDGLIRRIGETLAYPLFVKPANLGSSVGISKVKTPDALPAAVELALAFDPKVVVEAAVIGAREIECAVLGNEAPDASVPGEIIPDGEFYDYDAKYLRSGSRVEVPASIPAAIAEHVRRQSLAAFRAIEGAGLARVDFFLAGDGTLVINEINTMPGFTTISMYPKLWEASGVDYVTLIDRLIAFAGERHAQQQRRRTSAF